MNLGKILFSLDGRLNRKPYWIVGIVFLVLLILATVASVVVSTTMMQTAIETGGPIEPALHVATFVPLGVGLLLAYPSTAVMVKRFHDLGKSGKWTLLLLVPALGKMATDLLGLTGQAIPLAALNIDGTESFFETWRKGIAAELRIRPVEFAVGVYIFLVTVWFFIMLGFFRGTAGSNRYGADPLAKAAPA